jgi:hypothetical protein
MSSTFASLGGPLQPIEELAHLLGELLDARTVCRQQHAEEQDRDADFRHAQIIAGRSAQGA